MVRKSDSWLPGEVVRTKVSTALTVNPLRVYPFGEMDFVVASQGVQVGHGKFSMPPCSMPP